MSGTHLSCGHSKWDSRRDCITCLQFAVDMLNSRLSRAAAEISRLEEEVKEERLSKGNSVRWPVRR